MNKQESIAKFVLLIFTACAFSFFNFDANAAGIKEKLYRARVNDTEFIINSGFLTNYRRISSNPIIDYINLEEDEKVQIGFTGIKRICNWENGAFKILNGKIIYEDNVPDDKKWVAPWLKGLSQVIFESEGCDGISFISEGRLLSKWTQVFSWENNLFENEDDKLLKIKWNRIGDEIAPLKVTIAFPRNSQDAAYVLIPDKIIKLRNKDSVKITKGTKISVPVMPEGATLEISFDCNGVIRLCNREKIEALLGGWMLEFIPDDSESIKEFSFQMTDRAYKKLNVKGLEIAPNLDSGSYSVFSGGMPLFQAYGIEGKNVQDRTGNWTTKYIKNQSTTYIQSSGTIVTDWKTFCRTTGKNVDFKFLANEDGNDKGIMIKIPYDWVGSRFLLKRRTEIPEVQGVVPPYGKTLNSSDYQVLEKVDDCPLRIGSCMDLGNASEGSVLEWFPTESEKISFKLKQGCKIISGRDIENSYNNPFDITAFENWKEIVMDSQNQGAIEFRPDAFLCIYPVKNELSIECSHENIQAGKTLTTEATAAIDKESKIQCERKDNKIVIKSPYWQVTHDGSKGWVPTEIIFPFGLNRNILKSPVEAYLVDSENQTFVESQAKDCNVEIKQGNENITLAVKGLIGNVPFKTEYGYDRGGIKRILYLDFKKVPTSLKTVGVVRIETDPALDYAKYKPCLTRFVKAIFPGAPITQGNRITGGVMGLYRQNGEGIDFHTTSDLWKWYTLGENKGFFAIKGNKANPVIVAEALHVEKVEIVDGPIEYSHYIGLPETKNLLPRNWRVCSVSMPRWFTDNVVSAYADAGVNVAIEALGNIAFGCYDEKCNADVIAAAKRSKEKGIMLLPFFEPPTFIKQAKEAMNNINSWSMGKEVNGIFKPTWAGPYLMCCYDSQKMCDFMKQGYRKQINEIPNDGIYCDFIYPMGACYNKSHGNGVPHLGTDGLIDFCRWIKKDLLKEAQIYCAHTGYCPVTHVERYCDVAWIGEELNNWYSDEGRPISLNRISECGIQASNIQRILDPHVIFSWMKSRTGTIRAFPEDQHAVITRFALNGIFPLLHNGQLCPVSEEDLLKKAEPTLRLFRAFKGISLSDYYFMDWKTQNVVNADDPYVKTAVYFKDKNILIVFGIPEDYKKHDFSWTISEKFFQGLGLDTDLKLRNTLTGEKQKVSLSTLSGPGIKETLNGFDFTAIMITSEK